MNRWILIVALAFSSTACTPDKEEVSELRQRQDKALADPFNYTAYDPTDISGGGLGEFNKDGFKRDLNSVFNP